MKDERNNSLLDRARSLSSFLVDTAPVSKGLTLKADVLQKRAEAQEWFKNTILDRSIPSFLSIMIFTLLTKDKSSLVQLWPSLENEIVGRTKGEIGDNSFYLANKIVGQVDNPNFECPNKELLNKLISENPEVCDFWFRSKS